MVEKYRSKPSGEGVILKAVADENGVIRPAIDPLRCGVLVCNRPASGAITTATGVSTGYTVPLGSKLLVTEWEICSAVGANLSFDLYNNAGAAIGATRYGGIVVPTGGITRVKSAILIDATAVAVTVWLDTGTTGTNPDLCIYGIQWKERSV